jgi:hypothetical protein
MSEANPQPLGPPFSAAVYTSHQALFADLQAHACANGFALVLKYIKPNKASPTLFCWNCDKAGKYNNKGKNPQVDPSRQRTNTGSKKTGCQYVVFGRRDPISHNWTVEVRVDLHNHRSSIASSFPAHRRAQITPEIKEQIVSAIKLGQPVQVILSTLRQLNPDINILAQDIYNMIKSVRIEQLNGKSPPSWLLAVCNYQFLNINSLN